MYTITRGIEVNNQGFHIKEPHIADYCKWH